MPSGPVLLHSVAMRPSDFEPYYEAILADFGFSRAADEAARDELAAMTGGFDHDRLAVAGTAAIVAPGPTLAAETPAADGADTVVAVSDAAGAVDADLVVTDLDGDPQVAVEHTHRGVPVAVHAHGDNVPALREHVPRMAGEWVLPTTQAAPVAGVENHGGFTDGDRAAFLADAFGAAALTFVGWDLADDGVDAGKRRKLRWAARLLAVLERERGERFEVLDELRAGLWDGVDADLPILRDEDDLPP